MTGNAWEIARIIEPHVERVVVVSPSDTGIRQARAKTDRLDARTLAKLLAASDRRTNSGCRTSAPARFAGACHGEAELVRARTRAKNEVHAALIRRLIAKPKVSDLFGVAGRRWLHLLRVAGRGARDGRGLPAPDRVLRPGNLAELERVIALDALDHVRTSNG